MNSKNFFTLKSMPSVIALCFVLGLSGCSTEGDFGRKKDYQFTSEVWPRVGAELSRLRKEPGSRLPLTDQEILFRDMSYPLLLPLHPENIWSKGRAILEQSKIVSPDYIPDNPYHYTEVLQKTRFKSHETTYRTILHHADADQYHFHETCKVYSEVARYDDVRRKAMQDFDLHKYREEEAVKQRMMENAALMEEVLKRMAFRKQSYTIALEHAVILAPSEKAIRVDNALSQYAITCEALFNTPANNIPDGMALQNGQKGRISKTAPDPDAIQWADDNFNPPIPK